MGNFGIWQLLIVALIVVLLFGTKKLRNIGGDLGGAVKGFKKAMSDDSEKAADKADDKTIADQAAAAKQVADAKPTAEQPTANAQTAATAQPAATTTEQKKEQA